MSLTPEQIKAIENGSHEPTRECFQCGHSDEHPHGWHDIEFMGGRFWTCDGCFVPDDDASIQK